MSHCFYCDADFVSGQPCRSLKETKTCAEWNEHYRLKVEAQPDNGCDHRPMKSAIDSTVGCKLCGQWLGWQS